MVIEEINGPLFCVFWFDVVKSVEVKKCRILSLEIQDKN
jgi:hypothetical protein